jgi:hypothetical protein
VVEHDLEAPQASDDLYLARGAEVEAFRPIMTGDVYVKVPILSPVTGETKNRSVMVVQHPCALRSDGATLNEGILVAVVRNHPLVSDWTKFGKLMPLPDLIVEKQSGQRHQAAMFDALEVAHSEALLPERRIACLTEAGVCLTLQRFNHHNSRVVVPSKRLMDVVGGPYEEIDITEEWCRVAAEHGVSAEIASADCVAWLREDLGEGRTRQLELEEQQHRSRIRRDARAVCQGRDSGAWTALVPPPTGAVQSA